MDDKALVKAFQAGDSGAFETLVRLHQRAVYNMVFRYMGDHGATDDVVQETFMKAYHAIGSFRGDSSFKSWLIRIAVNTAKNSLRSRDRHPTVDVLDVELKSFERGFGRLEDVQTAELLRLSVSKLSPRQREALELRIYDDLSFKEIAEVMECPFDTAKANFRHAVMNLKKILETAEGGRGLEELRAAFAGLAETEAHEN
ncbi:MAG: sigma-70 family RNA polymerase sigma factor [Bdellovibrionales bacterium]|nr:sigma-70 family RNA polymerase sigma factor [Bdellovibrionales bacterium]